jgi:hypothetical protein
VALAAGVTPPLVVPAAPAWASALVASGAAARLPAVTKKCLRVAPCFIVDVDIVILFYLGCGLVNTS